MSAVRYIIDMWSPNQYINDIKLNTFIYIWTYNKNFIKSLIKEKIDDLAYMFLNNDMKYNYYESKYDICFSRSSINWITPDNLNIFNAKLLSDVKSDDCITENNIVLEKINEEYCDCNSDTAHDGSQCDVDDFDNDFMNNFTINTEVNNIDIDTLTPNTYDNNEFVISDDNTISTYEAISNENIKYLSSLTQKEYIERFKTNKTKYYSLSQTIEQLDESTNLNTVTFVKVDECLTHEYNYLKLDENIVRIIDRLIKLDYIHDVKNKEIINKEIKTKFKPFLNNTFDYDASVFNEYEDMTERLNNIYNEFNDIKKNLLNSNSSDKQKNNETVNSIII
jgi:hypothetical protein